MKTHTRTHNVSILGSLLLQSSKLGLPSIKPFPVYTTLSCPTLTRAHTRRWSLLTWLKRFSQFFVFWSRENNLYWM